jgi:hypothetical protein
VFKAIPAQVQYRPARRTERPRIEGTLSGFVDAEGSGKYAELDDQGRYKVQVPFDLTDKRAQRASAWLRFATPYAGRDEGMHFPLRKGSEVLLSFEGGDPNRPIIIGAVANSEHANVVTNRNATYNILRTGGDNLLEMEDQEGSQHIVLKTPVKNSFLAMGASGGAALVAAALDGNRNGPAAMTQYTEGDQLVKAEGSLTTEVGLNAVTKGTPGPGDTHTTLDSNLVTNVAGYAQLNVGPGLSPATPPNGDAQINTSGSVVVKANGHYDVNCEAQTIRVAGDRTEKIVTDWNSTYNNYTSQSWVNNEVIYGLSTSVCVGFNQMITAGLYLRLFGAIRLTVFLLKMDFCYSRWERIAVFKFDMSIWYRVNWIWGIEAVTCTLNANLDITGIANNNVRIAEAVSRLQTKATEVRTDLTNTHNDLLALRA